MMKRLLIACAIAAGMVATGAQAASGHGGGGWSGGHGGGGWSGGHGNWHGGGHFNGHGFNHFRGARGFVGFGSVYLGWPYWWGPSYYYDYPAYYYNAPTYYDYPTQVYVEPSTGPAPAAPQSQSQFYCPDTGYYPAVQTCPRGWLRVVPDNPPN